MVAKFLSGPGSAGSELGLHFPLLFFLKCLDADDARRPEFIRDEIKACEWVSLETKLRVER